MVSRLILILRVVKIKSLCVTVSRNIINQSINQSINLYRAIVQRRVLQCGYAESKRNVLRRILNVLTDGAAICQALFSKKTSTSQYKCICREQVIFQFDTWRQFSS